MPSPVALTVCANGLDTPLSPFFGLAPWLMVLDPKGAAPVWLRNSESSVAYMVELIRGQGPSLAICGHIPGDAALALIAAGIELRVGPCSVPARSLIPIAATLPTPGIAPMQARSRPGSA